MRQYWVGVLHQTCHNFLAGQGTTVLGFISNWIPSILSALVAAFVILRRHGRQALIDHWRQNLTTVLAAVIVGNIFWYAPVFAWTAMKTIYQEHFHEHARILDLTNRVSELQTKSPYEKSFIGSFAFTNTVGAFAALTRDPRYQANPSSECQIKITTPRTENKDAAMGLRSIAADVGCYVQQEPYDPDMDPETSKEIQQSRPNFVVVHAAKENHRAEGFIVGMGNTFHVQRAYDLPPNSFKGLIWLQIGPGSIWRIN